MTSVANNLTNPVTWQYDLGIQRQLPGQMLLGVHYVGNGAGQWVVTAGITDGEGLGVSYSCTATLADGGTDWNVIAHLQGP